jgi:pyridine nucleotide-disulfide oxidoreductase family protein
MSEKQIVLLGIGHTNAHVLHMWRRSPISGARLVCVSNFSVATYSGMLPGSLTGQYPSHRMEIDLVSLARAARAKLVIEPACAVDLDTQSIHFDNSGPVRFDVLSLGVGSVPNMSDIRLSDGLVPIKPMQTFLMRLYERIQFISRQRSVKALRVLVAGGGVGGIEISFCLPRYLRRILGEGRQRVNLIDARERIGRGLSSQALRKVEGLLRQRGVGVITGRRVERVMEEDVFLANGDRMKADVVVWATDAVPPPIVEKIALPKDPKGFLLTHNTLQSTGAVNIFAVGDSGTVERGNVPKAGVYAVRQGPVLWKNIRSLLRGRPLISYVPQHDFLRLLNTGDDKALLDYKGWAVHARWCWLLKDWIDTRFVSRFCVTRN